MTTDTKEIEIVLASSHAMLTVNDLRRITGLDEPTVRAQLKALAQQGQIEHIPGRGRHDGRYGLLRPVDKSAGNAAKNDDSGRQTRASAEAVQVDDSESEGGETDIVARLRLMSPDTIGADAADEIENLKAERDAARRLNAEMHADLREIRESILPFWPTEILYTPSDIALAKHVAAELTNARSLADKLEHLRGSERTACAALREQIEHMTRGGDLTPSGYLVRAPKRAHRIVTKQETAQAHALAAARNGSGRGEVFALVPVGRAVRGAEWRPAK